MEQRTLRRFVLKNIVYTLVILICYIVQETPGLEPFGIRFVPVISAVSCIAMLEGEFSGGIFGLFAGVLCDSSAFHIFGVASILFLVLGVACGLAVIYLIQCNIRGAALLTFGFALIYLLIDYYIIYGMWGYEGAVRLIWTNVLPAVSLTVLCSVPMFYFIKKIHLYFNIEP